MPHQEQPELTPEEREGATEEEIKAAQLALAEVIVEAMDVLIETGQWDPREGVAGLERLLTREPKRHDSPPSEPTSPRS